MIELIPSGNTLRPRAADLNSFGQRYPFFAGLSLGQEFHNPWTASFVQNILPYYNTSAFEDERIFIHTSSNTIKRIK